MSNKAQSQDLIERARAYGILLFLFAAISAASAPINGVGAIIDGVIFVFCGYGVRYHFSRLAALVALVLAVMGWVMTARSNGDLGTGGRNILVSTVVVFVTARALEATVSIRKLANSEPHVSGQSDFQ